jgi:hypothetical protein
MRREVPEKDAWLGASVTTWSSAENGGGPVRARGVGCAAPSRAGALTGAAADAGRLTPLL